MGKEISIEDKKFTTPEFRLSFPKLFEAVAFGGGKPKYSLTMLLDKKKKGILEKYEATAKKAAEAEWGDKADKVIKGLKGTKGWPFRDGDAEKSDMAGYAGHVFITASSKSKPGVIDRKKNEIIDEEEIYAGCYCRAVLIACAYDNEFGKGISFNLQHVQKLKDGEKFSGKRAAEDEFDDVEDLEDGSDDEENYDEDDGF